MKTQHAFLMLTAFVALQANYPCVSGKSAKRIAEHATGGEAVWVQKIPMNGTFFAWEVLVHMPGEKHGWRITIDRDTSRILKKSPIENPASKRA